MGFTVISHLQDVEDFWANLPENPYTEDLEAFGKGLNYWKKEEFLRQVEAIEAVSLVRETDLDFFSNSYVDIFSETFFGPHYTNSQGVF